MVEDDGQFGVFFQGRQCDGILVHSQQPVIISQTIDHVFETGAGWRQGITGKCGQVLVDFFGVNKLRKFPEMDDKQGDTPDVIIQSTLYFVRESPVVPVCGPHVQIQGQAIIACSTKSKPGFLS